MENASEAAPGPSPVGAAFRLAGCSEPVGFGWAATEEDTAVPATGRGSGRVEKPASSGGGKSAMDRSCSSSAGGGGGGHEGS